MHPAAATSHSREGAIDPAAIPFRTLASGARLPAIGLGTFGSDHVTPSAIAEAVKFAASIGYRHFDCASIYGNEAQIGAALQETLRAGIAREDLWITSKVWNDMHAPEDVLRSCKRSLADLRLEYLDLYLVHWPFPNHHPAGCDVSVRSPNARPYIHEEYMKTWRQMEKLVQMGLVREIGTSNMTVPKLNLLLRDARIKPVVNEMELHPHFQQPELFDFCVANAIHPVGYCPLGSPGRPERDRTPEDTAPIEDQVIRGIAERHGLHPAEVCLKWAVQRGQTPIPFSTNQRNIVANLRAVTGHPLSGEEMGAIARIDRSCRMIKGQVFLWKENQSWEDLWDVNGVIPQ